jgi:hypothetical protein
VKQLILAFSGTIGHYENQIEQLPMGETLVAGIKGFGIFCWLAVVNFVFAQIDPPSKSVELVQQIAEAGIKLFTLGYIAFKFGNEIWKWRNRKKEE